MGVAPHPETRERFLLTRVGPRPELVHLPGGGPAPVPAGDGRYYAQGRSGIYDALLDRWIRPAFSADGPDGYYWPLRWTSDGKELVYDTLDPYEGGAGWLLTQPKIEIPPFSEEDAFRVVSEGACVELRDEGRYLGCLEEDTRVVTPRGFLYTYYEQRRSYWIRVRTEYRREGSVLIENLEWY